MDLQEQVAILSRITTRDEGGRHFAEVYDGDELESLEAAQLIEVARPVHKATGIRYASEHWSVVVTAEGIELVEAYPEYHDEEGALWNH